MAGYEKQTWTDKISDVTAERMNHIEKGIEDAGKTGGVETGSVIGWTGAEVPEGYEEVDSSLLSSNSGVLDGTIVEWEEETIPEGWEEVENENDYSEEEQLVGKYLGKNLYRITKSTTKANLLSELNAIKNINVIHFEGFMFATNGAKMQIFNSFSATGYNWNLYIDNGGNVNGEFGSNFSDSSVTEVTMYYTKTTD